MRVEHKPTEVRRHEIIEATQKIILTRGMGHLTVEAIAQEVALTEGAIYRHFTSKQEVLLFLLDDVERTLFEKLEEAKEAQGSSLKR
ncbi:MAG: helix-turn-helix domain-containing protein, partial [Dehalococcoidia bacterium]